MLVLMVFCIISNMNIEIPNYYDYDFFLPWRSNNIDKVIIEIIFVDISKPDCGL